MFTFAWYAMATTCKVRETLYIQDKWVTTWPLEVISILTALLALQVVGLSYLLIPKPPTP